AAGDQCPGAAAGSVRRPLPRTGRHRATDGRSDGRAAAGRHLLLSRVSATRYGRPAAAGRVRARGVRADGRRRAPAPHPRRCPLATAGVKVEVTETPLGATRLPIAFPSLVQASAHNQSFATLAAIKETDCEHAQRRRLEWDPVTVGNRSSLSMTNKTAL